MAKAHAKKRKGSRQRPPSEQDFDDDDDDGKWLPVPEALRRLTSLFGTAVLLAAAKLLKPMRSGALPTKTLCVRLRDGKVFPHFPEPSFWRGIDPETLIVGAKEIGKGPDGRPRTFVDCCDFVDKRRFYSLFPAAADQSQQPTDKQAPLRHRMIFAILDRLHPNNGYVEIKTADLVRELRGNWEEECAKHKVTPRTKGCREPDRNIVDRLLGRRPRH